ncbi:MAG: hypothetical protein F9K44_02770 [Hyphomicrobiaceae bacterium]|nr:MAG: hypothetical protein F9K44_02770 [Hyphomicrobiaceae bacterium]
MSAQSDATYLLVHGTCVAVGPSALLLRGPAGSGKSDLALRLVLDPPSGVSLASAPRLVADDQCRMTREEGKIIVRPPMSIAGLIEVRGLGVIRLPYVAEAELRLIVDLLPRESVERLPTPGKTVALLGANVSCIGLHAFDSSSSIKVLLALATAVGQNYI